MWSNRRVKLNDSPDVAGELAHESLVKERLSCQQAGVR